MENHMLLSLSNAALRCGYTVAKVKTTFRGKIQKVGKRYYVPTDAVEAYLALPESERVANPQLENTIALGQAAKNLGLSTHSVRLVFADVLVRTEGAKGRIYIPLDAYDAFVDSIK
jgi:hypothetical protein